jgi:hypothetical protein
MGPKFRIDRCLAPVAMNGTAESSSKVVIGIVLQRVAKSSSKGKDVGNNKGVDVTDQRVSSQD